jgi:hypothetical protein
MPTERLRIPQGRSTIRKRGSLSGIGGPVSRPVKLWPFDPKPNTILARLQTAYMSGLDAVDRIEDRTRSAAASGKFTPDGVKNDALQFALSDLIPALHRSRILIRKAKAEVSERKSKLKLEGPDKTDIAAAFRRMEVRTFLREMKSDEQAKYFASLGDNLPADVAMAILELPREFSGVPQSRHDLITANALEIQHGPEMAEIAELEEAIAAAESAVEAGRDEVRLETGILDLQKFNELAAPVEVKHNAPWLRRRKSASGAEEIRVVDLVEELNG